MTECRSSELQDLLPDFVAESLDDITTARVAAHVAQCAACADDLAVLRMVRQARPRVLVPDIARIVAALPQPMSTGPRLVPDDAAEYVVMGSVVRRPATVAAPPTMQPRAKRGQYFGMSTWRLAATLGVMIAGGTSLMVARRGLVGVETPAANVLMVGESASAVAVLPDGGPAESVTVATTNRGTPSVSVSYGDLGDYTEAELERMLDRLDQWDGATSTEPLPGVPIIPPSGGSAP